MLYAAHMLTFRGGSMNCNIYFLFTHLVRCQRMSGAITPFPNTPSWRGAHWKKAQGQLYLLPIRSAVCILT